MRPFFDAAKLGDCGEKTESGTYGGRAGEGRRGKYGYPICLKDCKLAPGEEKQKTGIECAGCFLQNAFALNRLGQVSM